MELNIQNIGGSSSFFGANWWRLCSHLEHDTGHFLKIMLKRNLTSIKAEFKKIKAAQYKADWISNLMATEQPLTKNLYPKLEVLKYLFRLTTGLFKT